MVIKAIELGYDMGGKDIYGQEYSSLIKAGFAIEERDLPEDWMDRISNRKHPKT